jgi:cation transport ATPase
VSQGNDIAVETAGVVLMRPDLTDLCIGMYFLAKSDPNFFDFTDVFGDF